MMTSIWYEILPVTLESDQVLLLRRREDGEAHTWQVLHQAGRHPNATVLEHVARFFGELFEPDGSIVHSTSWRYCDRSDRLILTVVYPNSWRICSIKLVHVGLRSSFGRLVSLINWHCLLPHLFNAVQKG
jgi:hypothetical protein